MTKEQFITGLAEAEKITKKQATEEVNRVFGHLLEALPTMAHEESLKIEGIKFTVKDVAPRKGRNPQTQEEIDIPATRKLSISPLKALKDAVAGK